MSKIYYRIIFLSLFLGLLACNKKKVEVEQKQEVTKAQGLYYQNGASIGDFQITNEIPTFGELLGNVMNALGLNNTSSQIIYDPNALPLDENQKIVFVYSFKMFMKILDEEASKKTKGINFFYLQNKNAILYTKKDGTEVSFEQAFNAVNYGNKNSYFERLWNITKEIGVEEELLNIKDWKYEKIDESELFIGNELYYLKDGEKKQVTEQAYRALLNMLIISFHKNSTMEFQGGDFLSFGQTPEFDPAGLFLYTPIALLTRGIDHESSIELNEYNKIIGNIPDVINFMKQLPGEAIAAIIDYFITIDLKDFNTTNKEPLSFWMQSYIDQAYTGINALELNFKENDFMDFFVSQMEDPDGKMKDLKTSFGISFGKRTFEVKPIKGKESSLVFDIEKMDPDHLDLKFQGVFGSWADLMSFLPFKSRNVPQGRVDFTSLGEHVSDVVLVKMLLEFKSIDYFLKTFNISIFGMNNTKDIERYVKDYAAERYPIRLKLKRK